MSISPKVESLEGLPQEAAAQLEEAFRVFNDAAGKFGERYASLERRVAELNLELEQANARLRRNLEEKQRVQEHLSTLLESLPLGVIGADRRGLLRSINRRAIEILELEPGDHIDRPLAQVMPECPGLDRVLHAVEAGFSGDREAELEYHRPRDGRKRVLALRLVPTEHASPRDGQTDAAGVLLIEDVTEMRRLEQQADRNNRLTAMGEIAMNVAHEIRNPLGSIELFASMLQRDLAEDAVKGELAKHICTGVRCLDHIVANILQFSQPQRLALSSFDLLELIDETIQLTSHASQQKEIALRRDADCDSIPLWADADLLRQMLLNLLLNAVHATQAGGRVGIRAIPNCTKVELQVWDSGSGFAPGQVQRIFDPFYTTRRKGTGLGLTIVHNIVTAHQGSIEADNRPEGGAIFTIVLPLRVSSDIDGTMLKPSLPHCQEAPHASANPCS